MPITFKTVPGKNYFKSLWKGEISDSELIGSYRGFLEGPDWAPSLNELADLSEITFTSITSRGINQFSRFAHDFLTANNVTEMRSAIFCEDALSEGMAKLYKSLAENSPEIVEIFDNISDAESWVNV